MLRSVLTLPGQITPCGSSSCRFLCPRRPRPNRPRTSSLGYRTSNSWRPSLPTAHETDPRWVNSRVKENLTDTCLSAGPYATLSSTSSRHFLWLILTRSLSYYNRIPYYPQLSYSCTTLPLRYGKTTKPSWETRSSSPGQYPSPHRESDHTDLMPGLSIS